METLQFNNTKSSLIYYLTTVHRVFKKEKKILIILLVLISVIPQVASARLYYGSPPFPIPTDESYYIKIEWKSPGITVNPSNISFNLDSPTINWEKINICIYNPPRYHVINASVLLIIPENIELKANPDSKSIFIFEPQKNQFTVENFGNFTRDAACDWFEIKPNYETTSGKKDVHLVYDLNYKSINESTFSTYGGNHSPIDEQFFSITHEQNLSILITKTEKSYVKLIQENTWLLAIASLTCAVLLLVIGPGNKERIVKIKKLIKK